MIVFAIFCLLTGTSESDVAFELAVMIPESELSSRLTSCRTYAGILRQDAYAAGYFEGQAAVYREYLDRINSMRPGDK